MALTMHQRVRVPDYVHFREVEGEAVLVNFKSEIYFGLDEVGTRMWQEMTTQPTLAAAHETLLLEFDVTASELQAAMLDLVLELQQNDLILISNT